MKYQVLAVAGLAAVIAFCCYMILQLDARGTGQRGMTAGVCQAAACDGR
jgi:hypothetical protein